MDRARAALADLTALDRTALEALIVAQQSELSAQQEKLLSRDSEIKHLKLVIAKLRRMMFGTKSEKVTREIEQLELKLEELETRQAEHAAATTSDTPAKNKPTRRPLTEHLPREVHTHLPDEVACNQCGGELRNLGEDISEMLEYVPASFKVIRHVRPKLSCTKCDVIVEAPAPSRPIERGLAGPGLLAHVLVAKYADHLPLYRQSEIYAREGVDLDRSTLADWVGASSHLLAPLVDAVRRPGTEEPSAELHRAITENNNLLGGPRPRSGFRQFVYDNYSLAQILYAELSLRARNMGTQVEFNNQAK